MNLLTFGKNKKACVVTHIDLDGVSCVILFKIYLEHIFLSVDYIFVTYDELLAIDKNIFCKYDCVIFTDIAPDVTLYEFLKHKSIITFIFDHHITSYSTLYDYDALLEQVVYYHYNITICGTKILYDYLLFCDAPEYKNVKQYVMLVNTYDCWDTQSQYFSVAKDLHNVLMGTTKWSEVNSYYKFSKFIAVQLYKFQLADYFYFTAQEKSIIQESNKKEMQALLEAKSTLQFRIDNQGNKYAYFYCNSKLSITASSLLQEYPDLKYIVCHSTYNDKNGMLEPTLSLRSNNSFDVSEIAKQYGGGGHYNASGITFKNYDFFLKFHKGEVHLI